MLDWRVAFAESLVRPNYPPATLMAAETKPRPRLSQCRAYSVLASISLCASCIAASGIGGEVRARSRILANAGTAISSLSALPSCPLRSLMSDVPWRYSRSDNTAANESRSRGFYGGGGERARYG